MRKHIENEDDLIAFANAFAARLQGKTGLLFGLVGNLGTGKTTFLRHVVQALTKAAHHPESSQVTSPTFGLIHEYPVQPKIIHIDLYRLDGKTPEMIALALDQIGFRDYLDGKHVVFIEWIDRLPDLASQANLVFEFSYGETDKPEERNIQMTPGVSSPFEF